MTDERDTENDRHYEPEKEEIVDTGADAVDTEAPPLAVEETPAAPEDATETQEGVDYAEIVERDLIELKAHFPELGNISDITEIENPMRYAALRDLGLSATEAYLATNGRRRRDNRSHLSTAVPRGAGSPKGGMSREELSRARDIFSGLSDTEIQALYRKVSV